jgi:hypothetical protein
MGCPGPFHFKSVCRTRFSNPRNDIACAAPFHKSSATAIYPFPVTRFRSAQDLLSALTKTPSRAHSWPRKNGGAIANAAFKSAHLFPPTGIGPLGVGVVLVVAGADATI